MRRTAVAVAAAALALVLGLVAQSWAGWSGGPRSWIPDLLVGWLLATAGALAWARRAVPVPTALLTVAAGVMWWSGNVAAVGAEWLAWPAGQLVFVHRALLLHAVVAAHDALRRWDGIAVVAAGYVLASPLVATRPVAPAALGVALLVLLVRLRRSGPEGPTSLAGRRPVAAGVVLAATLLVSALQRVLDTSGEVWLLVYEAGIAATGLALTRPWRWAASGDVIDLVVDRSAGRGGLGQLLAEVLGDPGVRIVEVPAPVSPDAGPAVPEIREGYVATPVSTNGGRVTVLVHRVEMRDDPDLMSSVVRAVRLLLEHERLQVDLARRVDEVEQSRGRLLRVADEESARLRDRIRHGSGARLDAVVAALLAASARAAAAGDTVDDGLAARTATAEERARRVRQDLADVERALLPDLDRTSLATALGELAETSPVPVVLEVDGDLDVPRDLAAVVWFVCAEGLTNVSRHAQADRAEVSVVARDGGLLVTVADDGRGAEVAGSGAGLDNLRDRVEAVGGRLRLGHGDRKGTVLAAELPLDGRHRSRRATEAGSRAQ